MVYQDFIGTTLLTACSSRYYTVYSISPSHYSITLRCISKVVGLTGSSKEYSLYNTILNINSVDFVLHGNLVQDRDFNLASDLYNEFGI